MLRTRRGWVRFEAVAVASRAEMRLPRASLLLTATAVFLAAGSLCQAATYTADQFAVDQWVGKTVRWDGWGTETETNFAEATGPVVTPWAGTQWLRLQPANEVIDGHLTNTIMLWDDQQAGPPDYEGNPGIASSAEGWIVFGHHPNTTGEREHFINGITIIPATMTVGDSFPDSRCTSWEGRWSGSGEWTGACTRTISIVGIETITLPTGPVDALRIDSVDDRTKHGVLGDHWATEHWETSIWLVEGVGLVRLSEYELKHHYDLSYDNGNSPLAQSISQSDFILTMVPEPATGGLLALGALGLGVGTRQRHWRVSRASNP